MIARPIDDIVDAHFFSKEGATHAEDQKYLISSKGNDDERLPLAKSCGKFNGVDNEVVITDSDSLNFTDGSDKPFSITGWINIAALGSEKYMVFKSIASNTRTYAIYLNSDGKLNFDCYANLAANVIRGTSTNPVSSAKWAFLAGTYDGTELSSGISVYIFEDNIEVGGATIPHSNSYGGMVADARDLRIGGVEGVFSSQSFYDVRIHNVELSNAQIEDVRNFKPSGAEVGQWYLEEKAGNVAYDSHNPYPVSYKSDFSQNVDGWDSAGGVTVSVEDSTLKTLCSVSSTANHYSRRTTQVIGITYIYEFEYFIPSTATNVAKVQPWWGSFGTNLTTLDAWTSHSTGEVVQSHAQFRIYGRNAGSTSFAGDASDFFFIRNVKITQVAGATNNGTINGDLTNFWYEGADVPNNFSNVNGYGKPTLYESDFSVGFDGWTETRNTQVLADNIGGSSIKVQGVYPDAVLNTHNLSLSLLLLGKEQIVTFEIYIPSGQTNVNSYKMRLASGGIISSAFYPTLDTWVSASFFITAANATNIKFSIQSAKDGITSYTGTGISTDDLYYIRNVVFIETNIKPAINPTTDALGNALTNPGAVRHRAKVKDVNVGSFDGLALIHFERVLSGKNVEFFKAEMFIKTTFAEEQHFFSKYLTASKYSVRMFINASGFLVCRTERGDATLQVNAVSSTLVNDGVFHKVAFEFDNGNLKAIVDDVVEDTQSFDATMGFGSTAASQKYVIGAAGYYSAPNIITQGTEFTGTIWDVNIYIQSTIEGIDEYTHRFFLNEGEGGIAYNSLNGGNGTWQGHTDPNQWGKSDDAIDYNLIDTKLRGATDSKIDFNPYLALGEAVPTDYEAEGLVPADAFMYMNQTFVPSPTFGTEATAAIDNMEIKTPYERQFVAEFVEELLDQGNHALIDELMLLGLRHGAGLKMMKGSVVPVNNGGIYIDGVGFSFAGAEWIDTLFNPTINNVAYAQDSAIHGIYLKDVGAISNIFPYGAGASTGANALSIEGAWAINGTGFYASGIQLNSNSLYVLERSGIQRADLYKNGVSVHNSSSDSGPADSENFNIGAVANGGVPIAFSTSTVSAFVVGGATGFDQVAFADSLLKVQTKIELGNQIKDILIYNSQLQTADDVRRLYAYINEPVGALQGLQDYEAVAVDNLIRNERSI